MNTKFCINCGNEIPKNSVFCPKCGAVVKTDSSNKEESEYSNKQCIYCYQKIPKNLKYCPSCHPKFLNNYTLNDREISKNSNFFTKLFSNITNSISKYSKNIDQKVKGVNLNKINAVDSSILSRYGIDKTFIIATSVGIVVALIGGYIWSLISIGTGYEIGFMATGLGILCGFAVHVSSGQRKGTPFLQIAIVSSLFGIIMGKFFVAHYYLNEFVIETYGAYLASQISPYSWFYIKSAFMIMPDLFSGFDILWGILAILGVVKILNKGED
ncbi:MAG: zinc ribbon domain-containing protein [Candidatus Methanofastidiosum sp.]|nr:zinc ribbon domain-containing protein [Methanofastidiosum sp.]OQC18239.1 MAG: Double zinc ribbon [Firmicutes bacterium ADurb.Bin080]